MLDSAIAITKSNLYPTVYDTVCAVGIPKLCHDRKAPDGVNYHASMV